ncbi:6620_t:CDS:1, partial [Funneliformis caledonium]
IDSAELRSAAFSYDPAAAVILWLGPTAVSYSPAAAVVVLWLGLAAAFTAT